MGNYDELEVYYEQIQAYCLEYYKSTENKNVWEMANDLMDMEGPVSYTHLDVYKRQSFE